MNALEFSTKVEHGQITLPEEYKSLNNTTVRIIILSESVIVKNNSKEQLKSIFNDLKNITSFNNIENVIDWQKSVRDEW
jgi:hypothetical protein